MVQGKPCGKQSKKALAVLAGEIATALIVIGEARASRGGATDSVHAISGTARFAGDAGVAMHAARSAAVDTVYRSADIATALTVGGAGAGIGLAEIRGATLAVGADSSAAALSVGGAGATVRYSRGAAHTVHAALLSLCTAGEGSASATDLRVGAARTAD